MDKISILLIEDDPQQAPLIQNAIKKAGYAVAQVIDSESKFLQYLRSIGDSCSLSLVVSDMMLPWAFPNDISAPEPPVEVKVGTFRYAGHRCWSAFRRIGCCKTIPWIYFTILDELTAEYDANSDGHTYYVQKDRSIKPLLEIIRTALRENSEPEKQILLTGKKTPLADCSTEL